MEFAVVPTHTRGKRRPKQEMAGAEQAVGILHIAPLDKSGSGRPMLAAYLKDPQDRYGRTLIPPLFDVKVTKLTDTGMHLVGYQIEVEEGNALEYVQGWWAKFLPVSTL